MTWSWEVGTRVTSRPAGQVPRAPEKGRASVKAAIIKSRRQIGSSAAFEARASMCVVHFGGLPPFRLMGNVFSSHFF